MMVESKYGFGDIVYLKTDTEQKQRMITAFNARHRGILFELTQGTTTSWHNEFEFCMEKNILTTFDTAND